MNSFCKSILAACVLTGIPAVSASVVFPGQAPGPARLESKAGTIVLGNSLLKASYKFSGGKLSFAGLTEAGKPVAGEGGELFILTPAEGKPLPASSMTLSGKIKPVNLEANPKAPRASDRLPGKALEATFLSPDKNIRVVWRAVLRDGSHYLRNEMKISAAKDTEMKNVVGMQFPMLAKENGELSVSGNTRGSLLVNEKAFAGLETPMGINAVASPGGGISAEVPWSCDSWVKGSWGSASGAPQSLEKKYGDALSCMEGAVKIDGKGDCKVTFTYSSGTKRLNLAGVQLTNEKGKVLSEDLHAGFTGQSSSDNVYTVKVPAAGEYTLRVWAETKTEPVDSAGSIAYSLPVGAAPSAQSAPDVQMAQGVWNRKTTLKKGETWDLSSVLGLFAPGQDRRSVLAYVERERALPYRPFVHYNSWYELNINRNDNPDPAKRMSEQQCLDVLAVWNEEMFKKRGVNLDAFVWDDGWDDFNSLWGFHKYFPNGFKAISKEASAQKAGIGTWLGPVGGYGGSKAQRLANWNKHHPDNQIGNFQLANKEYYDAFSGRCLQMIKDYDMRYFKFDGISTHFHATGPDASREEDAEGILRLVGDLRKQRPDLFINCTVGTWASPFWFRYADSVWRQENDWGSEGQGDNREKWITYRDRLIWDVFVKGSPLCPINSLMFHGLIVSKFGPPNNMPKELEGIKHEMRCAFASGSALQELYVDRDLMSSIGDGVLWDELAQGIKWMRKNADVLSDVHWVGGKPWDEGSGTASIYGWASWNPSKATLALRNPGEKEDTLTITPRKALDLPPGVKGKITFTDVYGDQRKLDGFTGVPVDVDEEITFKLNPFEVLVFDGGAVK